MIHLDYETTSLCDIGLGAYRQANDPSTKILMFAIADGDGEPLIWDSLDRAHPESIAAHTLLERGIRGGELIYAHSAQFEVAMTHYRLAKDVGLEPPPLSVWRCTQAMCRRAAIPPSLANAAAFLGVTDKDKVGALLINIFSKQNQLVTLSKMRDRMKVPSPLMVDPIPWDWTLTLAGKTVTVREAWELFKGYCKQDVRVEQQIHAKLHHFELEGEHLANFQFNMRMNHRGIPVNLEKLHAAKLLVDELQGSAAERLNALTGCTPTQTARFTLWLEDRGYPKGKGIAADVVEKLMVDPTTLSEEVRTALLLRGESAFAAVAKIPTMIAAACDDGLVRGTVQDFGARTGRATGQIIQVQNFRKATIAGAHVAYDWLGNGLDVVTLHELWGEPLETLASCVRHFIQDPAHDFLDVDFAGIEARITPWLSGDTDELNVILSGKDQYKVCASEVIFNVPYEAVTKEQRTTAKPVVLSCCIAEGELVLTNRGLVPIEQIQLDDMVWDGIEWVHHEGLLYQGMREVIEYQGLHATPDHEVFTEGRIGKIPLWRAKLEALRLVDTGTGGPSVWGFHADESRDHTPEGSAQGVGEVLLRDGNPKLPGCAAQRNVPKVQLLRGEESNEVLPQVVGGSISGGEEPLHPPTRSSIQALRGSGDRVQVSLSRRRSSMDDGELGGLPRPRTGSCGQQWPLRSGELEVVHSGTAVSQYPTLKAPERLCFSTRGMALLGVHNAQVSSAGTFPSRDNHPCTTGSLPETKELANHSRKVRVYDLLNAGPRHRFTVSGKLVSNCFGTGGEGLMTALWNNYGIRRTLKECDGYVAAWRKKHKATKDAWKAISDAAIAAIKESADTLILDGKIKIGCRTLEGVRYLIIKLPNGRKIFYPKPEVKRVWKEHSAAAKKADPRKAEEKGYSTDEISFYGKQKKGGWGRVSTWGSRLFENCVQAIGADFLNHGCLKAEAAGYDIFMVVHDQALALNTGPLDGFVQAFCTKPEWALDFPLDAAGAITPYYLKED